MEGSHKRPHRNLLSKMKKKKSKLIEREMLLIIRHCG